MKKIATIAIVVMLFVALIPKLEEVHAGFWATAYDVKFTHYDPWWQPHYGAYFSGAYGSSQYFTGNSGAPSDYGSWHWWGPELHVLLLSKTWLFAPACMTFPNNPSICNDRWDGGRHHAYMAYH